MDLNRKFSILKSQDVRRQVSATVTRDSIRFKSSAYLVSTMVSTKELLSRYLLTTYMYTEETTAIQKRNMRKQPVDPVNVMPRRQVLADRTWTISLRE